MSEWIRCLNGENQPPVDEWVIVLYPKEWTGASEDTMYCGKVMPRIGRHKEVMFARRVAMPCCHTLGIWNCYWMLMPKTPDISDAPKIGEVPGDPA